MRLAASPACGRAATWPDSGCAARNTACEPLVLPGRENVNKGDGPALAGALATAADASATSRTKATGSGAGGAMDAGSADARAAAATMSVAVVAAASVPDEPRAGVDVAATANDTSATGRWSPPLTTDSACCPPPRCASNDCIAETVGVAAVAAGALASASASEA